MIRNIFEILSLADWITPLVKLCEDIAHGGPANLDAWTFFIPNDQAIRRGWSGWHIEKLLNECNIQNWGHYTQFGEHSFSVNRADAARVKKLLTERNIPIHPRSQ